MIGEINGTHIRPMSKACGGLNGMRLHANREWWSHRERHAKADEITVWNTRRDAKIGVLTSSPASEGLILAVVNQDPDFVGIVYRKACYLRKKEIGHASDVHRIARSAECRNEMGFLVETNIDGQTASLKFFLDVGSSVIRDWEAHRG